jgi:hypothetical protein
LAFKQKTRDFGKAVNADAFVDVVANKYTSGVVALNGTAATVITVVAMPFVMGSSLLMRMSFFATATRVRLLGWVVNDAKHGALCFFGVFRLYWAGLLHPHGGGWSLLGDGRCH